jgi:hypothetical protein
MSVDQVTPAPAAKPLGTAKPKDSPLAQRLSAGARGLFFVWLGVAVLAQLGWGWTLLGIGVVILGEQVARWRLDLAIATGWAIGGAIFVVAGLWQLIHIAFPLAPLLLILLGAVIIWNGFFGKDGQA